MVPFKEQPNFVFVCLFTHVTVALMRKIYLLSLKKRDTLIEGRKERRQKEKERRRARERRKEDRHVYIYFIYLVDGTLLFTQFFTDDPLPSPPYFHYHK
jgi:hypothetical protein